VVDDEKDIRDVIAVYLRNENMIAIEAEDGIEALQILEEEQVDIVILDVMMPRLDGIKTCMRIRKTSDVPILMLSAKQEDFDKINGLTLGADDYLGKPFNPLELVARIKAQLRRHNKANMKGNKDVIQFGELIIDIPRHHVIVDTRTVQLTPLEFRILELLARHPGQVFSADNIYESVWKEQSGNTDNNVMVHIRNLREKIEKKPREPRYILTVWGVGYKFNA